MEKHWTDNIYGSSDGKKCHCGSDDYREAIYDARGIFVTFVCDSCRRRKLSSYRPDIFTHSDYWHDEPID